MPPLPPYAQCLAVRHMFDVGDDVSVATRLHYTYTGTAPSDATCATIAQDIYNSEVTNIVPVLGADNSITGVSVQDLTTSSSGFGEYIHQTTGTEAGTPLAAGTAVLLNIRIARRYRGGKPRTYWPLGTSSDLTNPNEWANASINAFKAAIGQVIDDTIALSVAGTTMGTMVNLSYYEGFTAVLNPITGRTRDVPKVRSVAIAPDVFIGIAINPRPASQRRRNLQN